MSKVFANTFYFLALLNKNDEAHENAVAHAGYADEIVTTEWVLIELACSSESFDRTHSARARLYRNRTESILFPPIQMPRLADRSPQPQAEQDADGRTGHAQHR